MNSVPIILGIHAILKLIDLSVFVYLWCDELYPKLNFLLEGRDSTESIAHFATYTRY